VLLAFMISQEYITGGSRDVLVKTDAFTESGNLSNHFTLPVVVGERLRAHRHEIKDSGLSIETQSAQQYHFGIGRPTLKGRAHTQSPSGAGKYRSAPEGLRV
jgi:hypothetical protein